MRRLLDYRFEWILAGHGDRVHLSATVMKEQLEELLEWMEAAA
jgi:hypothetical protein